VEVCGKHTTTSVAPDGVAFLSAASMAVVVVFDHIARVIPGGTMNHQALWSFIWSVADLLRGDYKQSDYSKTIMFLRT